MIKTFTLKKIEEEHITATEGKMTFHLMDELGDPRTVSGTTFLDEKKVAKGISSKNKRELPLIQNLFELEVNDTIDLEFKYFNDVYDRDTDKTVNQVAYEKVLEMQKERKLFSKILDYICGKPDSHSAAS